MAEISEAKFNPKMNPAQRLILFNELKARLIDLQAKNEITNAMHLDLRAEEFVYDRGYIQRGGYGSRRLPDFERRVLDDEAEYEEKLHRAELMGSITAVFSKRVGISSKLYNGIISEFARILGVPVPAGYSEESFATERDRSDEVFQFIDPSTSPRLRTLETLLRRYGDSKYLDGFKRGSDMLGRLVKGEISSEEINDAVRRNEWEASQLPYWALKKKE
jgi:hypothetical protein